MTKTKGKHFSTGDNTLILKMAGEGASDKEIARIVGRTRVAVYTKRRKLQRAATVPTPFIFTGQKELVNVIIGANVPKDQKLKCLEALL